MVPLILVSCFGWMKESGKYKYTFNGSISPRFSQDAIFVCKKKGNNCPKIGEFSVTGNLKKITISIVTMQLPLHTITWGAY